MKPDRQTAMYNLIRQVRLLFPFEAPEAQICGGGCNGCSLKLLEYLDMELEQWQSRLDEGYCPDFGEISRLTVICKKIHRVLKKNALID